MIYIERKKFSEQCRNIDLINTFLLTVGNSLEKFVSTAQDKLRGGENLANPKFSFQNHKIARDRNTLAESACSTRPFHAGNNFTFTHTHTQAQNTQINLERNNIYKRVALASLHYKASHCAHTLYICMYVCLRERPRDSRDIPRTHCPALYAPATFRRQSV